VFKNLAKNFPGCSSSLPQSRQSPIPTNVFIPSLPEKTNVDPEETTHYISLKPTCLTPLQILDQVKKKGNPPVYIGDTFCFTLHTFIQLCTSLNTLANANYPTKYLFKNISLTTSFQWNAPSFSPKRT
jgi:hypothetical protein